MNQNDRFSFERIISNLDKAVWIHINSDRYNSAHVHNNGALPEIRQLNSILISRNLKNTSLKCCHHVSISLLPLCLFSEKLIFLMFYGRGMFYHRTIGRKELLVLPCAHVLNLKPFCLVPLNLEREFSLYSSSACLVLSIFHPLFEPGSSYLTLLSQDFAHHLQPHFTSVTLL